MTRHAALTSVLCLLGGVAANVEKVIFVAPPTINKDFYGNLEDLNLKTLSPSNPSIRLRTSVTFPNSTLEKGLQSWYLLDDLQPGRRYEVRVCWAAIVG